MHPARFWSLLVSFEHGRMVRADKREIWGILGGMGPIASAEFLNSIYRDNVNGPEQESPAVILISDPSIPDRTECLLEGNSRLLLQRLDAGIEKLIYMGATSIVICCVTMHALLSKLPERRRERVVSLLDLALTAVLASAKNHLLLCTNGTRKLQLFETHPLWQAAKSKIVTLREDDQQAVHRLIYELKRHPESRSAHRLLEELMKKYGVQSYIAGCTEMHVLAKTYERARGCSRREFCIDPLTEVLLLMQQPTAELAQV
jgi:aspartate racemase